MDSCQGSSFQLYMVVLLLAGQPGLCLMAQHPQLEGRGIPMAF